MRKSFLESSRRSTKESKDLVKGIEVVDEVCGVVQDLKMLELHAQTETSLKKTQLEGRHLSRQQTLKRMLPRLLSTKCSPEPKVHLNISLKR